MGKVGEEVSIEEHVAFLTQWIHQTIQYRVDKPNQFEYINRIKDGQETIGRDLIILSPYYT
jgi:hypothetical protein